MMEITCPLCKDRILVVPDLKAMTKAINKHVDFHLKEKREQNFSRAQIQHAKEEIEEALAQEVIKEICQNAPILNV